MREIETKTEPHDVIVAVHCDKCKTRYTDTMELQEFLHWDTRTGYSSVFGDDQILTLDLCQNCIKELLDPYIRHTTGWEDD